MLVLVVLCGLLSIAYSVWAIRAVFACEPGSRRVQESAKAIQEGAQAYLTRQYTTMAVVGAVIFALMTMVLSIPAALGFLVGAVLSGGGGLVGVLIAARANVRTVQAARLSMEAGCDVAFKAAAGAGMLVLGLALLSIAVYFAILTSIAGYDANERVVIDALLGLGFGASLMSMALRLGSSIFTKSAQVSGDFLAKGEAATPDGDPRNPAIIADTISNCAGMAVDLFATYTVMVVGMMLLGAIYFAGSDMLYSAMLYPLMIGAVGSVASIAGTFFVRFTAKPPTMGAFYRGVIACAAVSLVALLPVVATTLGLGAELATATGERFTGWNLYLCAVLGMLAGVATLWGAHDHRGRARSMVRRSTRYGVSVLLALVILTAAIVAYALAGFFGVATAGAVLVILAGFAVALAAFGSVTDTAARITDMAGLPDDGRLAIGAGVASKAAARGYTIGSAGLAALVLFAAYAETLTVLSAQAQENSVFHGVNGRALFTLSNPYGMVGLLFGGGLLYFLGRMAARAVGRVGMAEASTPDSALAVDTLTRATIRQMLIPALLPIFLPVLVFWAISAVAGYANGFVVLGALLIGGGVTGFVLAVSMMARETHEASGEGDMVGDLYKDTAGPVIKVIILVALLLIGVLVS